MKIITIFSIVIMIVFIGLYINEKSKITNPINQCYDIDNTPIDLPL